MRVRANFGRARFTAQPRRRAPMVLEPLVALIAVAALGWVAIERGYVEVPGFEVPEAASGYETIVHHFSLCAGSGGTCVIDGDTIRIEGQSVRIADIDTPEVRDYGCAEEKALGDRATLRMLELVNGGGFTMTLWDHRDADMYGRKLRVLERDGQSLGMMLVAEGLARPWGGARQSWCS
jgi:micrococcal nuclease